MNVFRKLNSRSFYLVKTFCSFPTIDYQNNIDIIKSLNVKDSRLQETNNIRDMKILDSDWKAICSELCSKEQDSTLYKRLPLLIINKFKRDNKSFVMDSLLQYVLKDEKYHDAFTILSIINSGVAKNGYFDELVKLYEYTATDEQFEMLFKDYIPAVLKSDHRKRILPMIDARDITKCMLIDVIKTSPDSESWFEIKKYVERYLKFTDKLDYKIEEPIFKKILLDNNITTLEEILSVLKGKCQFLSLQTVQHIEKFINKFNYRVKKFNMVQTSFKSSICQACSSDLPELDFSKKLCDDLGDALMKDVMKIDSEEKLYEKSSPVSLKKFNLFYESRQYELFDCIVDLPNILYITQHRKNMQISSLAIAIAQNLMELINLKPYFKKFCFIGKPTKFMLNISEFTKTIEKYVNKRLLKPAIKISYFITDKLTKDDILMLFLALKSGPKCFILSNDIFRDHKCLIEDSDLQKSISKWQTSRTIVRLFGEKRLENGGNFKIPSTLIRSISYDNEKGTWHIPFVRSASTTAYEADLEWVCLQLK